MAKYDLKFAASCAVSALARLRSALAAQRNAQKLLLCLSIITLLGLSARLYLYLIMSTSSTDLPEFLAKHMAAIAAQENFVQYTLEHKAGSNFGDGFMGDLLAVTLRGTRATAGGQLVADHLALICKMPPHSKARQEEFQAASLFARESLMYEKILPLLEKLQRDQGLARADSFFAFPKCYVAEHNAADLSNSVIIMQDLCAAGFRMWDKHRVTTTHNVRLFLQQLGRFHGLSFVLRDRKPEVFAEVVGSIPDIMVPVLEGSKFHAMFTAAMDRSIAALGEDVENVAVIGQIRDRLMELMRRIFDAEVVGKSAVIGHGDCWNNNMMFTFEGDSATSICLLDWQVSHMSSPAADLSNYLISSTDKAMRDAHMPEFLQLYYEAVSQIIRAFGSDPEQLFSWADLQAELRRFGHYGVLMAPMVLPVLLAQPEDIVDLNKVAANAQAGDAGAETMTKFTEQTEEVFRQRLTDAMNDARAYGWFEGLN